MNRRPYSVFVKPRPVRTAFLIDTDVFVSGSDRFEQLVDSIFRHNYSSWGGRTNPIVFFSGDSLKPEDWQQLEAVDVDCLKSFSPLPKQLVEHLDERLQPWSIEETSQIQADSPIRVESYGIACPPTPENLKHAREANILMFGEAKLLMFDFASNCEPLIERFIHRNFGTYDQWIEHRSNVVRRIMWLERLMEKISVVHVPISDRHSLAKALVLLAGTKPGTAYQAPLQFIAPNRLPSIHLAAMWPQSNSAYQVIIGDDAKTLTEFWNGVFWKMSWRTTHESQMWLPTDLAKDPILHDSLRNWLRRYTGTGNSNAKGVEFLSSSISATELDVLQQTLCNDPIWAPRGCVPQTTILDSRRQKAVEQFSANRRAWGWMDTENAVRFSGNHQEETFTLGKPEILQQELTTDGTWMADVQIELISSNWPTAREQSWWMAPRLNSGGLLASIFKGAARINRYGQFSVRVENKTGPYARGAKPELTIQLPDQTRVVPALITRPRYQCMFTADARYKEQLQNSEITEVRQSDKGKYLSGLIQVFGSFWTAQEFCDRRFWRHMFAKLANDDARKNERLRLDTSNLLKKRMSAHDDPDRLAGRILGLVRGRSSLGTALPYSAFKTELQELARVSPPTQLNYPQGDTLVSYQGIANLTEEEMDDGLNDLIELNVLRPGAFVRCLLCGLESWYHVDDLKQEVRCPGCGHNQSIGIQQEWSYALNSLVEMGIKQGQLSVLHALTALASQSHGSFVYSPSLELFKASSQQPWHEIDVPAIAKGEFVVGEVKGGDIAQKDFVELSEIAEVLRPQRAIMFLPHENVSSNVLEWMREAQNRLSRNGIKAQIYALPTF